MSDGDKDRFGDQLRDAEKAREDQFFAARDRQLLDKLKGTNADRGTEAEGHAGVTEGATSNGEPGKSATPQRSGWLSRVLGRSR